MGNYIESGSNIVSGSNIANNSSNCCGVLLLYVHVYSLQGLCLSL